MFELIIRNANINDLEPLAAQFDAYRQFNQQAHDFLLAKAFIEARLSKARH